MEIKNASSKGSNKTANAQADLNLCWTHMYEGMSCVQLSEELDTVENIDALKHSAQMRSMTKAIVVRIYIAVCLGGLIKQSALSLTPKQHRENFLFSHIMYKPTSPKGLMI